MSSAWTAVPIVVGATYSSTTTLLTNGAHRVIVDTGLSLEERGLRHALEAHGLSPDDIDLVINTHLHVDHCGNNLLFRRARIALSRAEWQWTTAFYSAIFETSTPERVASEFYPELSSHQLTARTIRNVARMARLFWKPERLGDPRRFVWTEDAPLPEGLEVMPTPGHTPHHLSIRVAGADPVIVAGDAVLNESPDAKVRTMIPHAQAQFIRTREALLQLGLRIIPGHGPAFMPHPTPATGRTA